MKTVSLLLTRSETSFAGKWDNLRHKLRYLLRADRALNRLGKFKDISIELRMIFLVSASFINRVSKPSN